TGVDAGPVGSPGGGASYSLSTAVLSDKQTRRPTPCLLSVRIGRLRPARRMASSPRHPAERSRYNHDVKGRAVLALLLLALAVRLAAVAATPAYVPHPDDRDYDRLACWISDRGLPP